jgi:hypothetical protein
MSFKFLKQNNTMRASVLAAATDRRSFFARNRVRLSELLAVGRR